MKRGRWHQYDRWVKAAQRRSTVSAYPPRLATNVTPLLLVQLKQRYHVKSSVTMFIQRHFFSSMEWEKGVILDQSLQQVKEHGWSEDALAAGVLSAGFPPAMVGLVTQQQDLSAAAVMVLHYMEQCNCKLLKELQQQQQQQQQETSTMSVSQKVFHAIQIRLRMNIPHLKSKRWHEAMAIGMSTPFMALETSQKLRNMNQIILNFATSSLSEDDDIRRTRFLQESTLSAVFIATELYMLTDSSAEFLDTWKFLQQRLLEVEKAVGLSSSTCSIIGSSSRREDAVTVMSALVTSLGGALFSLLSNNNISSRKIDPFNYSKTAAAATNIQKPQWQQQQHGSEKINVEDLPPFENDKHSK